MITTDLFAYIQGVQFQSPTIGVYLSLILTLMLLFCSGFASGAEIAFFSLSPTDISKLDIEHSLRDRRIDVLRGDSERTLATILITNNLVNVTVIMLCNYIMAQLLEFEEGMVWLQFLVTTVLLTFLLLLFGEIIPKIYSSQSPLRFCRMASGVIMVLRRMFWPLGSLLLKSGIIVEKISKKDSHVLSVDDLEQALELTDKEDIKEEQHILQGIIRFGDEMASDVMTSRQDIVALSLKTPFDEVIKSIVENNYSRIPVYQDSLDDIRGILYIKDLLAYVDKPATFRWQSLIRPAYFVPETKKIDDLLHEFQENKVHIAVLVDEFGGTIGIVTLEDILEEIVGEINDEFDEVQKSYTRLARNVYVFEAKTLLSDFYKILDIDDDTFSDIEGDAETLAGLLLEAKGDFPYVGEKIKLKNFTFEVLALKDRRIEKIKITLAEA